jgi:hypothetical protein
MDYFFLLLGLLVLAFVLALELAFALALELAFALALELAFALALASAFEATACLSRPCSARAR